MRLRLAGSQSHHTTKGSMHRLQEDGLAGGVGSIDRSIGLFCLDGPPRPRFIRGEVCLGGGSRRERGSRQRQRERESEELLLSSVTGTREEPSPPATYIYVHKQTNTRAQGEKKSAPPLPQISSWGFLFRCLLCGFLCCHYYLFTFFLFSCLSPLPVCLRC
jgi:hypothetical protein